MSARPSGTQKLSCDNLLSLLGKGKYQHSNWDDRWPGVHDDRHLGGYLH